MYDTVDSYSLRIAIVVGRNRVLLDAYFSLRSTCARLGFAVRSLAMLSDGASVTVRKVGLSEKTYASVVKEDVFRMCRS